MHPSKRSAVTRAVRIPPLRITNLTTVPKILSVPLALTAQSECNPTQQTTLQAQSCTTVQELTATMAALVGWTVVLLCHGDLLDIPEETLEQCQIQNDDCIVYRPLRKLRRVAKKKIQCSVSQMHPRIAALPPAHQKIILRRMEKLAVRGDVFKPPKRRLRLGEPEPPPKRRLRLGEPEPPPAPYYTPFECVVGDELDCTEVLALLAKGQGKIVDPNTNQDTSQQNREPK